MLALFTVTSKKEIPFYLEWVLNCLSTYAVLEIMNIYTYIQAISDHNSYLFNNLSFNCITICRYEQSPYLVKFGVLVLPLPLNYMRKDIVH